MFAPFNANGVGVFDAATRTFSLVPMGDVGSTSFKFDGATTALATEALRADVACQTLAVPPRALGRSAAP